mmetsp:Transcript_31671/g.51222  ORF Transcript_31671/g.51222 Transcript_31671/m.51222 type:complete len:592 (-) Transcript_31671:271-2046(-)
MIRSKPVRARGIIRWVMCVERLRASQRRPFVKIGFLTRANVAAAAHAERLGFYGLEDTQAEEGVHYHFYINFSAKVASVSKGHAQAKPIRQWRNLRFIGSHIYVVATARAVGFQCTIVNNEENTAGETKRCVADVTRAKDAKTRQSGLSSTPSPTAVEEGGEVDERNELSICYIALTAVESPRLRRVEDEYLHSSGRVGSSKYPGIFKREILENKQRASVSNKQPFVSSPIVHVIKSGVIQLRRNSKVNRRAARREEEKMEKLLTSFVSPRRIEQLGGKLERFPFVPSDGIRMLYTTVLLAKAAAAAPSKLLTRAFEASLALLQAEGVGAQSLDEGQNESRRGSQGRNRVHSGMNEHVEEEAFGSREQIETLSDYLVFGSSYRRRDGGEVGERRNEGRGTHTEFKHGLDVGRCCTVFRLWAILANTDKPLQERICALGNADVFLKVALCARANDQTEGKYKGSVFVPSISEPYHQRRQVHAAFEAIASLTRKNRETACVLGKELLPHIIAAIMEEISSGRSIDGAVVFSGLRAITNILESYPKHVEIVHKSPGGSSKLLTSVLERAPPVIREDPDVICQAMKLKHRIMYSS